MKYLITTVAWTLAKLSHIFPKTFYCEVYLKNYKGPKSGDNIRGIVWHPLIVNKIIKWVGARTEYVRSSKF